MLKKIWDFLAGRTNKKESVTGCGCCCDEPFNTPVVKKAKAKKKTEKKVS